MKKLNYFFVLLAFIFVANCSQHSVKLGKRCTQVASNGTYEKSYIWIVNTETVRDFESKITKQNCDLAEKS